MKLTQADREALAKMPEGWFSSWDYWKEIKRARWRCNRLFEMGCLERGDGNFPDQFMYRKTAKARELAGKENMTDINLMLQRLFEKWGFVDLMSVGSEWRCADSTDEGIGGPGKFEFYGKTPLQAVQKSYRTISRCF